MKFLENKIKILFFYLFRIIKGTILKDELEKRGHFLDLFKEQLAFLRVFLLLIIL